MMESEGYESATAARFSFNFGHKHAFLFMLLLSTSVATQDSLPRHARFGSSTPASMITCKEVSDRQIQLASRLGMKLFKSPYATEESGFGSCIMKTTSDRECCIVPPLLESEWRPLNPVGGKEAKQSEGSCLAEILMVIDESPAIYVFGEESAVKSVSYVLFEMTEGENGDPDALEDIQEDASPWPTVIEPLMQVCENKASMTLKLPQSAIPLLSYIQEHNINEVLSGLVTVHGRLLRQGMCLNDDLTLHDVWGLPAATKPLVSIASWSKVSSISETCTSKDSLERLAKFMRSVLDKADLSNKAAAAELGALIDLIHGHPDWPVGVLTHADTLRVWLYYAAKTNKPEVWSTAYGRVEGGLSTFLRDLNTFPGDGVIPNNLGAIFFDAGFLDDALALFLVAADMSLPFKEGVVANIAAVRQMTAAWQNYEAEVQSVRNLIQGGKNLFAIRNLYSLALPLSLQEHLAVSRAGAIGCLDKLQTRKKLKVTIAPSQLSKSKLHVCYVSSDMLTQHAVAQSVRMLPEFHSAGGRVRVSVIGRSPAVAEAVRKDSKDAGLADAEFYDGDQWNWDELAEKVNTMKCAVIMDLNAQTGRESMASWFRKPSPVIVHYLGFPSTTGADYVDYLIGDRIVTPPDLRHGYSEHLLFMPHTFQVTSHAYRRPHPWPGSADFAESEHDREALRRAAGMPTVGPLMCNFNQIFKLSPSLFDMWVNIAKDVPKSSIVMLRYPPEAEPNLRLYMRQRDMNASQLHFLMKAPLSDHLSRFSFCSIFLDNTQYNAGTTCTDSLWSGVPVVTLPGEKHASRHSASMLRAVDPDLAAMTVARTPEDYVFLASKLSNVTPTRAHSLLRRTIMQSEHESDASDLKLQSESLLWDARTWTGHLEQSFRMMLDMSLQKFKGHVIAHA